MLFPYFYLIRHINVSFMYKLYPLFSLWLSVGLSVCLIFILLLLDKLISKKKLIVEPSLKDPLIVMIFFYIWLTIYWNRFWSNYLLWLGSLTIIFKYQNFFYLSKESKFLDQKFYINSLKKELIVLKIISKSCGAKKPHFRIIWIRIYRESASRDTGWFFYFDLYIAWKIHSISFKGFKNWGYFIKYYSS